MHSKKVAIQKVKESVLGVEVGVQSQHRCMIFEKTFNQSIYSSKPELGIQENKKIRV